MSKLPMLKAETSFQQILECLHPKDRIWLAEKVKKQGLLSKFEAVLNQEERTESTLEQFISIHPELLDWQNLLEPQSNISSHLREVIRTRLLEQAEYMLSQETFYAD